MTELLAGRKKVSSDSKRDDLEKAIENLKAGGSTAGGAGIELAYALAQENFVEGGINRVIIASDGDMNVGIVDHEALKEMIETRRKQTAPGDDGKRLASL